MQIVTISFFRFEGVGNQLWAFSQMQFSRAAFNAIPGVEWIKQFGTGSKQSFHPYPNFSVYTVMATWPDLETARREIGRQTVFQSYRSHAGESWTVYLTPVQASGLWDGKQPFDVTPGEGLPSPIGILTRATVKKRHLVGFWKSVPNISQAIEGADGVLFKQGMGEVPWVHQVTFSIWENTKIMSTFAYKDGHHAVALKRARDLGWFHEELFARFKILDFDGTWNGASPLDPALKAAGSPLENAS